MSLPGSASSMRRAPASSALSGTCTPYSALGVGRQKFDGPPAADTDWLSLRQLRHHTKNALQGLIAQIDAVPELQETEAGRRLAKSLQQRILLSATVSDALFGFTDGVAPLAVRLRSLCENVVRLFGGSDQVIRTEVTVDGSCPADLHEAILRSVHEMVANAVKHGLHARARGLIGITLRSDRSGTTLTVQDDGWGIDRSGGDGQGLEIIQALIARRSGILRLQREEATTLVVIRFPRAGSFTPD